MPVQITIIGLGQIGVSMRLALASHKNAILRVGHNKRSALSERLFGGLFMKKPHVK
jgi:prephenate dehydrogenase